MKTGKMNLNHLALAVVVIIFSMAASCTSSGPPSGVSHIQYDLAEIADMEQIETESDVEMAEPDFNTEEYDRVVYNPFKSALQNPLSTFSIDVDNASYSNVRRFINSSEMPPKGAVRIEEMINYFAYDYPDATGDKPFSLVTEVAECPWNLENQLIHIGIQGKKPDYENLQPSNLTFLIDVSGSMSPVNKLGLVKKSIAILLERLGPKDQVSIVVYAGAAGLVLPVTAASDKETILKALKNLSAGGSTAGGEGIRLAYAINQKHFITGGNNRVILATDGDFNIGVSSTSELVDLIEEKRKSGTYLTICGYGMGNYKDGRMEQISNAGNGNYFYIDNIREAEKVFSREMQANLFTIARDVKIQVEFNPKNVKAYRLIGYENRVMANEDFNDDTKDAGELGAGHTVTAIYEIIPASSHSMVATTDPLRYQQSNLTSDADSKELMTLKLRYKPLDSDQSLMVSRRLTGRKASIQESSTDFQFVAAVAGFGMLLRDSPYKGTLTFDAVKAMAGNPSLGDEDRQEFLRLVSSAKLLSD